MRMLMAMMMLPSHSWRLPRETEMTSEKPELQPPLVPIFLGHPTPGKGARKKEAALTPLPEEEGCESLGRGKGGSPLSGDSMSCQDYSWSRFPAGKS